MATTQRSTRRSAPRRKVGLDYTGEIAKLVAQLRERDADPDYADAPVVDTYSRISDVTDAADDEKVERQTRDCLRKLVTMHARLGVTLEDPNRSAWKVDGKRPAWKMLLDRIESDTCNGVIAWHTDRLMRQPWDLEVLVRIALHGRYTVASCYGEHNLDNNDDLFQLRILTAAANKASADTSRRIRAKNESRREAGQLCEGRPVFGHRTPGVKLTDEQLKAERDALVWGAKQIIEGQSLKHVANEWNRRGLVTRSGRAWNPLNVRSCIVLARHAGLIEYTPDWQLPASNKRKRKAQILPTRLTEVDPVFSTAVFYALRAVFEGRSRGGKAAGNGEHFLSTWLHCAVCGTGMVGTTERRHSPYTDGAPRRQYRCTPRGCRSVAIDARAAEAWATHQVLTVLASPVNTANVARRSQRLIQIDKEIEQYETILREAAARVARKPETWDRYTELEDQVTEAIAGLHADRQALVDAGAVEEPSAVDVATLRARWESATGPERRQLVLTTLPHGATVVPAPKGVRMRATVAQERLTLSAA